MVVDTLGKNNCDTILKYSYEKDPYGASSPLGAFSFLSTFQNRCQSVTSFWAPLGIFIVFSTSARWSLMTCPVTSGEMVSVLPRRSVVTWPVPVADIFVHPSWCHWGHKWNSHELTLGVSFRASFARVTSSQTHSILGLTPRRYLRGINFLTEIFRDPFESRTLLERWKTSLLGYVSRVLEQLSCWWPHGESNSDLRLEKPPS